MEETGGPPVLCPNLDCKAEIEKEDDGTFPKYCGECGDQLPEGFGHNCPKCERARKKNKKGKYPRYCGGCRFDFETTTAQEAPPAGGAAADVTKAERQATTPDVPSTSANGTDSHELSAAAGDGKSQPETKPEHVTIDMGDDGQAGTSNSTRSADPAHSSVKTPASSSSAARQAPTGQAPTGQAQPSPAAAKRQANDGKKERCQSTGAQNSGEQEQFGGEAKPEGTLAQQRTLTRSMQSESTTGLNHDSKSQGNQPNLSYAQAASGKSKSEAKTPSSTTSNSKTSSQITVDETYSQFGELRQNVKNLWNAIQASSIAVSKDEKAAIGKLQKDIGYQEASYQSFIAQLKKVGRDKDKDSIQKKVEGVIRQMKNLLCHISPHALTAMAKFTCDTPHDEGATGVQPSQTNRPNCRRVEFWIVLSEDTKGYFANKPISVEIRSNHSNHTWDKGKALATLNETASGIWKGECITISKSTSNLEYKYSIKETGGKIVMREKLYRDGNRHLSFCSSGDDALTIYDGTFLLNVKKGGISGAFTGMVRYFTGHEKAQRQKGFLAMLPDWYDEIRKGTPIEKLTTWIENAAGRHQDMLTEFNSESIHAVKTEVQKSLQDYLVDQFGKHDALYTDPAVAPGNICLSMIGLIHAAKPVQIKSSDANLLRSLSTLIETTMMQISPRQHPTSIGNATTSFNGSLTVANRYAESLQAAMHVMAAARESYADWILLIPLYHKLKNINISTRGRNDRTEEWWGTKGFDGDVQTLKVTSKSEKSAWKSWSDMLQPFFQIDDILPYSFLSLLTADQFLDFLANISSLPWHKEIPIDGILACGRFHLDKSRSYSCVKKPIYDVLHEYLKSLQPSVDIDQSIDIKMILQLATTLLKDYKEDDEVCIIEIYLNVLAVCLAVSKDPVLSDQTGLPLIEVAAQIRKKKASDHTCTMPTSTYTDWLNYQLKLWGNQFQCSSGQPLVQEWWTSHCRASFTDWVHQLKNPGYLVEKILSRTEIKEKSMIEAIQEYLISIPEWWLKPENAKHLTDGQGSAELWSMIENAVVSGWAVREDDCRFAVTLNMVRKKQTFLDIWNFCKVLSSKSGNRLSNSSVATAHSVSAYECVMESIMQATVTLGEFEQLSSMATDAVELCVVSDTLSSRQDGIRLAFTHRQAELDEYGKFVSEFSEFWQCCKVSYRDPGPIDNWLARPFHELSFEETVNSESVKVICDLIPDDVRDLLKSYNFYKHHRLFDAILIPSLSGKATWPEIVVAATESMEKYDQLIATIKDGTVDVSTLKALKMTYFNGNKDDLLNQLPTMILDKRICAERSDQISICVELDEYYKGAEAIMKMKDMFELNGDFSAIEILVQAKEQTLQLKNISRQLVVSADVIRNITAEQIDCLDAFANCSEFVMWVRDEVQKNDIAVFVDLASSTLGEGDLAAQQTRYLLNTLTGYTPLLYDFNSEKAELTSFLDLCKRVWHNMETNPDLPSNLRWSASQTEFFKGVKTHYGSTEITTVSQAAAINSTGLYEIGNITGYSKQFKTLDDVIRLTCWVPEKTRDGETEDRKKTYTYTELKDLQSRLALVAGDKQKESADTIQHFDEMRDAVENLGNAYIDIKREGCIQFDDMMVVVHCNPSHAAGVEIRLQSIEKKMLGRTAEKSALEHCRNVYTYLNSCLKKWRESMDIQRSSSAELNFYTTEQLVVLRKELGEFVCEKDANLLQKAIPLLSMIHAVDSTELLEIGTKYDEGNADEDDIQDERPTYETMELHQQEIVDYLTDECDEFSRDMAVEVYNVLGDDASDIEKAMEWYEEWKREQKEKAGAGETSDDVLSKLMKESESQKTLQQRLDMLWDEFIDHTSKSIKNFLGIPHLSYVLRQLKEKSGIPERSRSLPSWLDRGKPVLIGVPQDQTYKMVLTIYEADKEFRKPTRNEVLVCTKGTRKDEVALFLNRALNDPLSFYCMVNCHLVKYKVCRAIENRLNNLADLKVKDYGLAFLYAEESKDARIKAYLDKYLARNSQVTESAKLMDYVRDILHVMEDVEVACCVDPSRSSARLIRSSRAGVGKSLQVKSLVTDLRRNHGLPGKDITISLHKTVDMDSVIARLSEDFPSATEEDSFDTIHLDIAHEVESGVDELLFNMIVLRSLVNSEGVVWQANQRQYCIIECMPFTRENGTSAHEVLDLLPSTVCVTPTESYRLYQNPPEEEFIGFNQDILEDERWQLVLKHLTCFAKKELTYNITRMADIDDAQEAVKLLIENCGLRDPTWSELRHYVHFLSSQLAKVISSPFCGPVFANELPGFKPFVIDFMFKMAKDFATRSLKIAEETPGRNLQEVITGETDDLFSNLSMKKTWEQSNYPYLFFNEDGETFTTLGFYVKRLVGRQMVLYNKQTDETFVNYTMPEGLYNALVQNELPVKEEFNRLSRQKQLQKLRGIMVKTDYHERVPNPKPDDDNTVLVKKPMFAVDDDPDPNYVLTMDNAKKIIAIHQRLRVDIPVIIMGETGCGKTKLIDFMGKLQVPTELKGKLKTMVIVKIHGGTTEEEIVGKIYSAQKLAEKNQQAAQDFAKRHKSEQVPTVYTILFLDEVNTTEAIGLVKEIICDNRMNGVPLPCDSRLKIVAACNPYRRHSDAMIEKLKMAGLGYNVGEDETTDKFCKIPMRHLVYRVQALSQSLLPLVWDFGTLQSKPSISITGSDVTTSVEGDYIEQMIIKFDESNGPDGIHFHPHTKMIAELMSLSQNFMRQQKDECSFVSLRDIQRLLEVSNWFYTQRDHFFPTMDRRKTSQPVVLQGANQPPIEYHRPNDVVRSVILAVGICYLARLETATRVLYTRHISGKIRQLMADSRVDGGKCLIEQVNLCQDMLIDVVVDSKQHKNIAKNKALKENVFMMIVCIENRIPLFVIGKPGSSKSLSKSMVFDSMKGDLSRNPLFKEMKNTYMVSFQCSRHATPSGIVGVFRHCAVYQKEQDLNKFVSVVVLDEVGLAEDSENMPLKALHPLLEDGCVGSEEPEPYKKCAFIGISNWALDPAKMNRGIFIQIGSPANNELEHIAREICRSSMEQSDVGKLISPLSRAYLKICQAQKPEGRDLTEFFGLRDFYSLMKMVVNFARSTGMVTRQQLEHSIKRNFGGFDPDQFSPMDIFIENCPTIQTLPTDDEKGPSTDSIGLIQSSLFTPIDGMDSRYLLILTENLSVLSVILNEFSTHDCQPEVVFGSRFSDDLSYTQVCHNLYRIKMCMDMGRPVILLNLDDLYESLYDALNQYFSVWGDKKFVDLGLGTHRVKAYVKDSFRLVLIADKNKVHSQFPIPLINRLEKHYVSATSLLTHDQKAVKEELEQWMIEFVKPSKHQGKSCPTLCDGCGSALSQPYRMPCSEQHYIGECCREKIFQMQTKECPGGSCKDGDIDESYEWTIDQRAFESRQYFENSSVSSSFIGYSSETTALVVKKATDDVMETRPKYDTLWPQVFERSKTYLLECATAESILRLNRTILQKEAADIQKIYMVDQRHENLLQYMEYELSGVGDESLQIQVTSFAEIMSTRDVNSLRQHLNLQEDMFVIESLYLKDYQKESLFTDSVRKFYEKPVDKIKLLIIQCESANENVELLDSVRYIVQREIAAVPEQDNHTVLLLSLARGHTFSGYQGGKWKCVHIDDPRSPIFQLPSLRKCMEMKPCELLVGVLKSQNSPEVTDAALEDGFPPDVDIETDDDDEPPPLVDIDEDDDGYIDTELTYGGPQAEAPTRSNSTHVDSGEIVVEDVLLFIEHCLPRAVSVIKCDQSFDRVAEMKRLFRENPGFQNMFLTHVYNILFEQDTGSTADWVRSDAAKASNMKKSETLRHALEDSLERSFRPAIAAVIAFIDPYNNLKLFSNESLLAGLCINLFTKCDNFGLNYKQLTKVAVDKMPTSRLPKSYVVRQVCAFTNRFPFSWIVKDVLDQLMEVQTNTGFKKGRYLLGGWLIKPFSTTVIGEVIMADAYSNQTQAMVAAYIHDFVYMTHPCGSCTEHWIVEQALHKYLTDRYHGKALIPHVHIAYKDIQQEMKNMGSLLKINFTGKDLATLVKQRIEEMMVEEEESAKMDVETIEPSNELSAENAGMGVEDEKAAEAGEPTDDIVTEQQDIDDKEKADNAVNAVDYGDVPMTFIDEEANSLVADVYDEAILPELEVTDQKMRFDVIALQLLIGELLAVSLQTLQKATQKWIDQVDQCKLLMEKILDSEIGDYNEPIVVSCRSSWTELELKKLYVEHVILPGQVDAVTGKRKPHKIMGFIKAVKEKVFHRKRGFEQVVASVTKLVKDGIRGLYKNCPPQCPVCLNVLGSPTKLPCGHLICDSCVGEIRMCPEEGCGEEVPEGYTYNPTEDDIDKKKLKEFEELRNGLNRFFMHFVSELVFSAGVVPEMDIIKWLTTCVTFRDMTKKFSLFNGDDIIDPTPVLRSFLLKLLLQCQDDPAVEQYLDETIRDWGDKNPLDQLPKMVMLMNCHKDLSAHIMQQRNLHDLERDLATCADNYPETNQCQQTPSIIALTSIADMHTLISKSVEEIWQETSGKELLAAMRRLLETARLNGNSQPGYFVIRQLIACAGEGYIKDFINTAQNFLVPDDVQEVLASFTVPDVLSAFGGEAYGNVKSLVSDVIAASGTEEDIEDAIGELLEACREDEALLLHTLFTRITRTMAEKVPVSLSVRQQLRNSIANSMPQRHQTTMMLELLLEDDAMPLEMNVTLSKGVSLSMLVLHLFTSISQCKEKDDLYPLTELITQPAQAAKHYLPTMMDDASEIAQIAYKEAFLTMKDTEQFKPYLCPNGHVYFIAGCGNPVHTTINCFCGAQIGGDMRNKLYANNKAVTEETMSAIRSKTGHILGHAVKRSLTAQAERELSPLSCAVLRCLLHLTMYTSSLLLPHGLLPVIEPTLSSVEELGQFLEAHIQIDLQQISQRCEESTDSCILLLHDVIDRLGKASDVYETLDVCVLESIEDRRMWENKFEIKYIQPTFMRKTDCLNQIKSRLNTGAPRDLADILSTVKNPINEENFLASAGLWGYARPLTLTSVHNLINADGKDYRLLEAMVTNCDRLIAVKSLPDIFSLIKMLCDKFHSQLSRAQADIDVDRFIAYHYTKFNLPENRLRAMIRSYVKAWNIAITCNDFAIADAEPLSDNPPLSEFLIDKHQRQTSHPLQLIRFLVETHNGLISVVDQNRPSLPIGEVTISMLVSVASRDEVISLISSHREYHLHTNLHNQDDIVTVERVASADGTVPDEEQQVNPLPAVQLHQGNLQAAESATISENTVLVAEQQTIPLPAAQPRQEELQVKESAATSDDTVHVERQALQVPTAQPRQEDRQAAESAAASDEIVHVVERQRVSPLAAQHHQDNLLAAEREATLKYIGTRCKIEYIQDDLPCYMYQEDFSLWNQMEALAENQERLDAEAQRSVTGSVSTTIQSLTTHLKNLSIVINYLSVMPEYDTDSSLLSFMERTVVTEPAYLRPTVLVKHVVHVWLLLKYTQTDALMYNSQKPFDDIEAQYTQELPAGAQAAINDICTFNSPRTKILLQELFEYIILRLNKEAIAQKFVEPEMRLRDALTDFVVRQNIDDSKRHYFIVDQLPILPDGLMVKHAAETWISVWKRFTTAIRD